MLVSTLHFCFVVKILSNSFTRTLAAYLERNYMMVLCEHGCHCATDFEYNIAIDLKLYRFVNFCRDL